ncbi:hypothetical protein EDD11_000070 [Mortierella claussenii]|nr:hypothetical protein EDD11_000070 [Mortierella claussenii]
MKADRTGSHRADHAIQTIWETVDSTIDGTADSSSNSGNISTSISKKEKQCRIVVMDYTSFWKGTLTRQRWEAQRHTRCEDMVNKDMYERLTMDAFKGVSKKEGDKWGLTLSVRSAYVFSDDLELTWAGSVTNTISGRITQQKTILGTMTLQKVSSEESKKTLQQWIKTTIEERQKFEHLSESLKGHVVGLDRQYQECKDLLAGFKLHKRRSQNDMLEKFRALINTKKEKIVKLIKSNTSLQERMEALENALKEERRKRAVLEGRKAQDADVDLSDIKKQEDMDDEEVQADLVTKGVGCGTGRGRGRGRGRARGRGKTSPTAHDSDDAAEGSDAVPMPGLEAKRVKLERRIASRKGRYQDAEAELEQPLPLLQNLGHPQDGYGWDEVEGADKSRFEKHSYDNDDEEEPLVHKSARGAAASSSTSLSAAGEGAIQHHLNDLTAGAHKLISRVSRAANHGRAKDENIRSLTSSPAQKEIIKREESDHADILLQRKRGQESKGDYDQLSRKRYRMNSNESSRNSSESDNGVVAIKAANGTPHGNPNTRSRFRYPVVSMRKAGSAKPPVVHKSLRDAAPPSSVRSVASVEVNSSMMGEGGQRVRSTGTIVGSPRRSTRGDKDPIAVASASIISEEDLYKELE